MRSPDAAWSLLEAGGPDEVTIRAVARAVNVSHAAPRHHFAGRSALIEAMIVEGFGWFVDALQAGWDSQEDPVAAFTEVGLAYVRFARTRPQVFQLITRPERHFPHGREDAIGEAAGRAFNVVLQGVEECQAVGSIDEGDPRMWAFVAWSGVHGLATMLDDGIAESVGIGDADELTLLLLAGMGHGLFSRRRMPDVTGPEPGLDWLRTRTAPGA